MRSRVIMVLAIATILLGGAILVPTAYARLAGPDEAEKLATAQAAAAEAALVPPPPPTLANAPVNVPFKGKFLSWALLDRKTGTISGAKNMTSTNSTESMLKVWLVSDYLRRLGDKQPSSSMLHNAEVAIKDSNDDAANALWKAGGGSPVLDRLIDICGLTDTKPGAVPGYIGWWSFTTMSPRDAVRMGDCVASGKAAGQKWTKWVLDTMSKVRGSVKQQQAKTGGGKWGIIDGLPKAIFDQGPVSIKNGWTPLVYDGNWHVNCLAVTDDWVLAVMMRYPSKGGTIPSYGASVCASVATQLVTPEPGAALRVPKPLASS
ncbi:hypothetical protein AB0J86_24025 [Micromonospora sp. NPDC049559]|uniref:hypothetical protein n=1 Tax=Micromonospora sp. NPDC049559 TaxID=3155923 RepID=UPI00342C88EF